MTQTSTFPKDLKKRQIEQPYLQCWDQLLLQFNCQHLSRIVVTMVSNATLSLPCLASTERVLINFSRDLRHKTIILCLIYRHPWTQAWTWWWRCWGWTQTFTHFPSFSQTSEKQSTFNVFLLAIPNYSTYSTMPGPTAASYLCAKCETAYDY